MRPLALVLALLTTTSCTGREQKLAAAADRFCAHRYTVDDERVPVSATMPLAAGDLENLERQLLDVTALYPRFASACGVPFEEGARTPPTLHVIDYEQLNDRNAFPRGEDIGNIVGRYYVGRSSIFVTERALTDRGDVHLPHELAHWIHDENGVTDAQEDERLARAFHRFYRQHKKAAKATVLDDTEAIERIENRDLLFAFRPEEGTPARDRSLTELADGHHPTPLFEELCGR